MNPFAKPEDSTHFEYPNIQVAGSQTSEYANKTGAQDYNLKDFKDPEAVVTHGHQLPVVRPALFQDFKDVLHKPS